MIEQVKYGILLPNGNLATVEVEDNSDRDFCNSHTYRLSDNASLPTWLTDDPDNVAMTLFKDAMWYNSSAQTPCWGKFKGSQLKAAKVVTIATEAPEIKPPSTIISLDTRDLPHSLARKYSGIDNLPREGKRYVCVLTAASFDELQKHLGQEVCFDECLNNRRKVIAIRPMTDDYDGPHCEGAKSILTCEAL